MMTITIIFTVSLSSKFIIICRCCFSAVLSLHLPGGKVKEKKFFFTFKAGNQPTWLQLTVG